MWGSAAFVSTTLSMSKKNVFQGDVSVNIPPARYDSLPAYEASKIKVLSSVTLLNSSSVEIKTLGRLEVSACKDRLSGLSQ